MSGDELAPEDTAELAAARRCGDPYLVYRDAHARQRVLSLPDTWNRVTIGRGMGADVALTWDPDVSRVHAELSRLADDWTVIDDGLSRNGTFVNDQRVEGRRRFSMAMSCAVARRCCCSTRRSRPRTRRAQPRRSRERLAEDRLSVNPQLAPLLSAVPETRLGTHGPPIY